MAGVTSVAGHTGGVHSYTADERRGFADHINDVLGGDQELKTLNDIPINTENDDLFKIVSESVLLCKLINYVRPGTIDPKKICIKPNASTFEKAENHSQALQACKKLNLHIVNIGPNDLQAGTPHLVLAVLWQIIRLGLMDNVSPTKHPEMIALLNQGEDAKAFVDLPPEATLLRWFNYHLKKAGHPRQISNFGNDIRDSELYLVLLNQLLPGSVNFQAAMNDTDLLRRASYVLDISGQLNCRKFLTPQDIVNGNTKLNTAFVANLFNKHPGLIIDEDATNKHKKELEDAFNQKLAEEKRKQDELFALQEEERQRKWVEEEERRKHLWAEEERRMKEKWAKEEEERKRIWEEEERKRKALAEQQAQQQVQPPQPYGMAFAYYGYYPGQPGFPPQTPPPPTPAPAPAPPQNAQVATWRPKDGRWRVSADNQSVGVSPGRQFTFQNGCKGDQPVAKNFFGNGVQAGVFRPSEGTWHIKGKGTSDWGDSAGNVSIKFPSKDKEDIPVAADYFGEGVARLAIFRPSEGNWYIKGPGASDWQHSQGNLIIQHGMKGDIPVPADYFGEGKARLGIFRPKSGMWYIKGPDHFSWGASSGNVELEFGQKDDIPVPRDYYGDGKARFAVFRPKEGNWYIKGPGVGNWNNSQGNAIIQHGSKHDIPCPADYYGEGKPRITVFRPDDNKFYIKGPGFSNWGSSSGNVVVKWGDDDDVPVVAPYGL